MTHQRRSYLYDVDTTAPKKATGPLERATTKKKKGKEEAFFISPLLSSSPLSPSPLSPLSSASPPSIFLVTWAPPSHGRTVSFPNERPAHRAGLGNGLRFLCKKAPPLFFPSSHHIGLLLLHDLFLALVSFTVLQFNAHSSLLLVASCPCALITVRAICCSCEPASAVFANLSPREGKSWAIWLVVAPLLFLFC